MQFLHPEWFQALWCAVLLVLLFVWRGRQKRKRLNQFGNWSSISQLTESHSQAKERLKKGLLLGAVALVVIALAQPQWGEEKKQIKRRGVEIIFLVDTSLSMLAEDVSPSRIEKAKLTMKSFLKLFRGDRIGIVTFAGSGFVQSPLTLDYDAFLLFVNTIQVGLIPDSGTSLSTAIETAIKAFPETKKKYHVIILLSDGEDLEGQVDSAIKAAKEAGIRIYTIGVGTEEGSPIPLRSEQGKVSGYKKDRGGNVVITKINESLLRQVADETGGLYFRTSAGDKEADWIYQHMKNIEKKEFKNQLVSEREDHFQFFLVCAIILLVTELLIGETKGKHLSHA